MHTPSGTKTVQVRRYRIAVLIAVRELIGQNLFPAGAQKQQNITQCITNNFLDRVFRPPGNWQNGPPPELH
jgi:hypothetical protein